jgi:hypothetical protein
MGFARASGELYTAATDALTKLATANGVQLQCCVGGGWQRALRRFTTFVASHHAQDEHVFNSRWLAALEYVVSLKINKINVVKGESKKLLSFINQKSAYYFFFTIISNIHINITNIKCRRNYSAQKSYSHLLFYSEIDYFAPSKKYEKFMHLF